MSWQSRYHNWLLSYGRTITRSTISGTACPCIASTPRNSYSAAYHAVAGNVADCNGTGILITSQETTVVTIYCVVVNSGMAGLNFPFDKSLLAQVGEVKQGDRIYCGGCLSTGVFHDLSNVSDRVDTIVFDGSNYHARNVVDLFQKDGETVGQVAKLVKVS